MLLAIPERVPLYWDFLVPQVLESGPTMHLPSTPACIAGLLPATCSAPAIASVATDRVIEFAHQDLARLSHQQFIDFRLTCERWMDGALNRTTGEQDNFDWQKIHSGAFEAIQKISLSLKPGQRKSKRGSIPSGGTSDVLWNTPERLDGERRKHLEEGRRLAKRLDEMMNLKVDLTDGRCLVGDYRFVLHPRRDGNDGVVVGRRQWGDYYQDHPRVVFSKEQLAAVLVELDAIGKPGAAVTEEVRRGKGIVDRGPVTEIVLSTHAGRAEAEIANLNEMRQQLARKTLIDLSGKMTQPNRNHVGQRH